MTSSILSDVLQTLPTSPTIAMTQKAREMKAAGRDVLALAAGEPDFETPAHIKEAAIAAIHAGHTRYTAVDGIPELKGAICDKFKRDNGLEYTHDEVVATPGGKYVIYAALMASLNPREEVIIPAPYWVSYPSIVTLAGGIPVIVKTKEQDNFILSPDALEAAITPKTKWLMLNSPGNPAGALYTKDQLEGIAEVLRRHPHIWLMTDDIYEHIIFDTAFYTLPTIAPDLKDRTLIVNGASKAYAMTGWRLGIGAGPSSLMGGVRKILGQSTSNPCSITQYAGIAAFGGEQGFLKEWVATFHRRRDKVVKAINAIAGLSCLTPQGAFYVYPSCADLMGKGGITNDVDFAERLLESEAVAVVPGAAFGLSPYFRISYATDDATLEEACARIAQFCEGMT